jgi:MoaA/NifB/PqqE/SkfB family radical SAM enzyme
MASSTPVEGTVGEPDKTHGDGRPDMSFMSNLKIARHFYDEHRTGPVMVDIHPTLACQNECYYCISAVEHITGIAHDNFSRAKKLEWPVLKQAIMDMIDMDVRSVQLTGGGEPTTYPEFQQLLKELIPLKVGLITNGILVGEYAKEIVEACDWVRISLDAVGEEMYKQIKGTAHYHEVIDSITKLVEARGTEKTPRIGVAYILTPESTYGMKEVVMELEHSGIDYLQFKDVVMRGLKFTTRYEQTIHKAIDSVSGLGLKVLYTSHGTYDDDGAMPKDIPQCNATDYVAVVGADGDVYGCCHLEYQPQASYGSIYKEPFQQIWQNRPFVQVSENLCWNCRYKKTNEVIESLKKIEDGEFL